MARRIEPRAVPLSEDVAELARLDGSTTAAFQVAVEPVFPPWRKNERGEWVRDEPPRGWDFYAVPAALLLFGAALVVGAVLAIWRAGQIGGHW